MYAWVAIDDVPLLGLGDSSCAVRRVDEAVIFLVKISYAILIMGCWELHDSRSSGLLCGVSLHTLRLHS